MQIANTAPIFPDRKASVRSCRQAVGLGMEGSRCDVVLDDGKEHNVAARFLEKVEV